MIKTRVDVGVNTDNATKSYLILETDIHWKARASQCRSHSMDWAEGGSEPMKINILITYIINLCIAFKKGRLNCLQMTRPSHSPDCSGSALIRPHQVKGQRNSHIIWSRLSLSTYIIIGATATCINGAQNVLLKLCRCADSYMVKSYLQLPHCGLRFFRVTRKTCSKIST